MYSLLDSLIDIMGGTRVGCYSLASHVISEWFKINFYVFLLCGFIYETD